VPLTDFQAEVARLLAGNRTPDSYLAGGAALHIEPNGRRTSNDLDFFHDSIERVASAFAGDRALLDEKGYLVTVAVSQPGYIRAMVSREDEATKVEWAHDSAWRFLPVIRDERVGWVLHPVDLAINKLLALAGRDEPRDFVDIFYIRKDLLPLGALCWAAAGKDPGFTPLMILDQLRRRGRYRPEDFARLRLTEPFDLPAAKIDWLSALDSAEEFLRSRPPEEIGCLYYSRRTGAFVEPPGDGSGDAMVHFGRPGGLLPRVG
jgi:hypothetical protein